MAADKPTEDLVSKLYAEWVSAGMKLSVAGFAAAATLADATAKALVSAKQKPAHADAKAQTSAPKKPSTSVQSAASNTAPTKATTKPVIVVSNPVAAPAKAEHDDLKLISGIGPKLEQMLLAKGITSFSQLALMDAAAMERLDNELNLNGRIARDEWVAQAKQLANKHAMNTGGQTWQN